MSTTADPNNTFTITIPEIICPVKDKCTSHPALCQTCQRNTAKRKYYIPEPYPYTYPYTYPWWYWQSSGSSYTATP